MIIIAAKSANNVIGKDNDLPWDVPEDLARFRAITKGHPVIMGHKTYTSILDRVGKPLPGRPHFVLSRSGFEVAPEFSEQVKVCSSLSEAIALAEAIDPESYVIGGEGVFREAIDLADKMELTEIEGDYEGDAFFPDFDESVWNKTEEKHDGYTFVTYTRR